MVDFWSSLDAAGKFLRDGLMDFWCFCIAHAKKVYDGMVDFCSSQTCSLMHLSSGGSPGRSQEHFGRVLEGFRESFGKVLDGFCEDFGKKGRP